MIYSKTNKSLKIFMCCEIVYKSLCEEWKFSLLFSGSGVESLN